MKLTAKKLTQLEIEDLLQVKLKWLLNYSEPNEIILFGSASNGEMTEASDIDLIAIFPNNANLKVINLTLAQNRPKNDWPQDLMLLTEEQFETYKNKGGGACWIASQEGRCLFKKGMT